MLATEEFEVGVTPVDEAVAEWKRRRRAVFVPIVYTPCDLAEVDFFEVLVDLEGKRTKSVDVRHASHPLPRKPGQRRGSRRCLTDRALGRRESKVDEGACSWWGLLQYSVSLSRF
jgi:hypothetical protein